MNVAKIQFSVSGKRVKNKHGYVIVIPPNSNDSLKINRDISCMESIIIASFACIGTRERILSVTL